MKNFKNATFDSLAITAMGSGIAMISALEEKWYIGLVLVAVGALVSFLKYNLREND